MDFMVASLHEESLLGPEPVRKMVAQFSSCLSKVAGKTCLSAINNSPGTKMRGHGRHVLLPWKVGSVRARGGPIVSVDMISPQEEEQQNTFLQKLGKGLYIFKYFINEVTIRLSMYISQGIVLGTAAQGH